MGYSPDDPLPFAYLLLHQESGCPDFWQYVCGGELDFDPLSAVCWRSAQRTWDADGFARQAATEKARRRRNQMTRLLHSAQETIPLVADEDSECAALLGSVIARLQSLTAPGADPS